MSKVIDLVKYKSMRRPNPFHGHSNKEQSLVMPASERLKLLDTGSRSQKRDLERLELKEQMRFGADYKETAMVLRVDEINNPVFLGTLHKLDSCGKYKKAKTAWAVMKLVKACFEVIKEQREFYAENTKRFAELEADGSIKVYPKLDEGEVPHPKAGQIVYKSPEDEKAHEEWFVGYKKLEVTINAAPLEADLLDDVGLTPMEIGALEKMIVA